MPASRLPLLVFSAGALLVSVGVACVYWPAGLICAGVIVLLTAVDFGGGAVK